MSESNIITGRFPAHPALVQEPEAAFRGPRMSLQEIARLTQSIPAGRKIDTGEIVALSEALDDAASSARGMMLKCGRAALGIVAQDLESLSERLVVLAAELGHQE